MEPSVRSEGDSTTRAELSERRPELGRECSCEPRASADPDADPLPLPLPLPPLVLALLPTPIARLLLTADGMDSCGGRISPPGETGGCDEAEASPAASGTPTTALAAPVISAAPSVVEPPTPASPIATATCGAADCAGLDELSVLPAAAVDEEMRIEIRDSARCRAGVGDCPTSPVTTPTAPGPMLRLVEATADMGCSWCTIALTRRSSATLMARMLLLAFSTAAAGSASRTASALLVGALGSSSAELDAEAEAVAVAGRTCAFAAAASATATAAAAAAAAAPEGADSALPRSVGCGRCPCFRV